MGQWEGRTFCAFCGYRDGLLHLVEYGCVCGGQHHTCSECRWAWRVETHLDPCPVTDEARVARALMAGEE